MPGVNGPLPTGRSVGRWFAVVLAAGLALMGCASSTLFQEFRAIDQQRGLLRWQMPGGDGLTAEAYFSRGTDGTVAVVIGKEGPAPLLEAVLANGTLAIRGPLTRDAAWTGPVNAAPRKLAPWGSLLSAYAQAPTLADGSQELHAPAFRAQFQKVTGKLTHLHVVGNDTGDTFTVRF